MLFHETCSIKINLGLRVLDRRQDGYHNIQTLFWRLPSPEHIEIDDGGAVDRVVCVGAEIEGENIVTKGCRYLRRLHGDLMPGGLDIRIYKHLPQGSGVGAGSGNVAALMRWFRRAVAGDIVDVQSLSSLGGDVAFLSADGELALAGGAGERLEVLSESLGLSVVIFFPAWSSDTRNAYRELDKLREGASGRTSSAEDARAESAAVLGDLLRGGRVGLLPNDFIDCMGERRVCYDALYETIGDFGAVAWGLSGSGSSCFGLFRRADALTAVPALLNTVRRDDRFDWLRQTLIVE
jgi:4-diphosphocytidyl-2-C-methyl-D-erythritol kinase